LNWLKEKTILVDCDGVLLDWEYAFDNWMARHDYKVTQLGDYLMDVKYGLDKPEAKRLIRMFNESATIRKLPPLRDAIHYVKKLHQEHGYVFHAITSLSNDTYSQHLRTKNLRELFGNTVFERYTYLDTGADKDEVLEEYRGTGCWWVEDKPANCEAGLKVGLNSVLVEHAHNADYQHPDVIKARNWKAIYQLIVQSA